MMNALYLKQAWEQMRQHRLYAGICILGTALPMTLVMAVCLVLYICFAPIYPEANRHRMMALTTSVSTDANGMTRMNNGVSYYMVRDVLPRLPHCADVGALQNIGQRTGGPIDTNGSDGEIELMPIGADGGFWRIFEFDFLEGTPFTQEQVDAKEMVAVISHELARQLFADDNVVGRKFRVEKDIYTVQGVVRGTTAATPETHSNIYLPIFNSGLQDDRTGNTLHGWAHAFMIPRDGDKEALHREFDDAVARYNASHADEAVFEFRGQPESHWRWMLRNYGDTDSFWWVAALVIAVLLIVPAFNISGMISSRMDERMEEMAIRKSYGATNASLVWQVIMEQMLLTLAGGVVGMAASYILVCFGFDALVSLLGGDQMWRSAQLQDIGITAGMVFNPLLCAAMLVFSMFVNVVSAFVPVRLALRKSIVDCFGKN